MGCRSFQEGPPHQVKLFTHIRFQGGFSTQQSPAARLESIN
jgi:hypothetical protein